MAIAYFAWRDGWSAHVLAVLVGSTAFSLLGLVDDAIQLSAGSRLVFQIAAASLLCYYAAPDSVQILDLLVVSGPPALAFQILWTVVCINFFNFMDGMDGLAGFQAFWFTFVGGWFIMLTAGDSPVIGRGLLCLSASLLAFLLWNLRPSTLFMGDSGSYFLGFLIGFLPLVWGHPEPRGPLLKWQPDEIAGGLDFTLGLLLFAPFLLDATLTIFRRLSDRHNIFSAHRTHLYQLLRQNGWSVSRVLVLYQIANLVCAGIAVWRERANVTADYFAAGLFLFAVVVTFIFSAATRYLLSKKAA